MWSDRSSIVILIRRACMIWHRDCEVVLWWYKTWSYILRSWERTTWLSWRDIVLRWRDVVLSWRDVVLRWYDRCTIRLGVIRLCA